MPYSLPKGIAPISFIGAAAGTIILLKYENTLCIIYIVYARNMY